MRKSLIALVSLMLLALATPGNASSDKCAVLGSISKKENSALICLKVKNQKIFTDNASLILPIINLGSLSIFQSNLGINGNSWFDYREKINFKKSQAKYIGSLANPKFALKIALSETNSNPRWDPLIRNLNSYVRTSELNAEATKNYFAAAERKRSDPESVSDSEIEELRKKMWSDSPKTGEVTSRLNGELEIFLNYLEKKTGVSDLMASRFTLVYLSQKRI